MSVLSNGRGGTIASFVLLHALRISVCCSQEVLDTLSLEPCESAQGWGVSRDASTYYKGVGASAVESVADRKQGEAALRVAVDFSDAAGSETVFVSKPLARPVDASAYDGVSLWYKLTSDKIATANGLVLRLRDATAKRLFVDLRVATRTTVVPGEWQHTLLEFPSRARFDQSAIGTVTFRIEDIDYYNTSFELTFDDIRLVKLKKPVVKAYEPQVLARSADDTLDVLYLRPGGACNYNLEDAIRSLPVAHKLTLCRVMRHYTNPWFLESEHGRTHWLSDFPETRDELLGLDVVILAGLPAEALTREQQRMVLDVVANGGGLLVVGGPDAFGAGGYAESELARALPVVAQALKSGERDYTRGKHRVAVTQQQHPVTAAIPASALAQVTQIHEVELRPGATTLLEAKESPVLIAGEFRRGRVLALPVFHKAYYTLDDLFHAPCFDDLLRQALLWLGGRQSQAQVQSFTPPPRVLVAGQTAELGLRASAPAGWRARFRVSRGSAVIHEQFSTPAADGMALFRYPPAPGRTAKGTYQFGIAVLDGSGATLACRDVDVQLVPPTEVEALIPCGRDVTAPGFVFEPAVRCANHADRDIAVRVLARVLDAAGAGLHRFEDVPLALAATRGTAVHTYRWTVPNLRNGEYTFTASMLDAATGAALDESALRVWLVREFEATDTFVIASFPGVAIASEVVAATEQFARTEIDALLAHGFNAIQLSGRMGVLGPKLNHADRVAAAADSYAQRLGLAIHGGCTSLTFRFGRDRPPEPCVHAPEFLPELEKRLESVAAWTCKVPRLYTATIRDEPCINAKMFCRCEHCRAAFQGKYGAELPDGLGKVTDPRLTRDVVSFYNEYMAKIWQASADVMHRGNPKFRIRNNYTSSLLGASRITVAMGDLMLWSEPLDIISTTGGYPYIKGYPDREHVDATFRRRRCTLAFVRSVAVEQGKPFGAWTETCIPFGSPPRAARRNVYATIGSGAKYITAWYNGISGPHPLSHPQLWADLGETLKEVASIGPLLMRVERKASVALLFPHSDWVLGKQYSGPFGRMLQYYEFLSSSVGNVDVIWERQIAAGRLSRYRVLFLPAVKHLRGDAAAALAEFVQGGGMLIADRIPVLDELGRDMDTLRELFAVTSEDSTPGNPAGVSLSSAGGGREAEFLAMSPRTYRAADRAAVLAEFTDSEAPAIIENGQLAGRSLLFAFDSERTHAEMGAQGVLLRELIRQCIDRSGVRLEAYSDNPLVECNYFEAPECAFLVLVNHSEQPQRCRIEMQTLPCRPGYVCDMLSGESIPVETVDDETAVSVTLDGLCGQVLGFYEARPARAESEIAEARVKRGQLATYSIALHGTAADPASGSHILRIQITDPSGAVRPEYGRLTCTTRGLYQGQLRPAANDPVGTWRLDAAEKLTGVKASVQFSVE